MSDDEPAIAAAVNALRAQADYVFTSGGIGPTHDDITADAVAKAFGVGIGVRDDARAILEAHYGEGGLNEARLRMARIPDGATLIDNPVSRAPGFRLGQCPCHGGGAGDLCGDGGERAPDPHGRAADPVVVRSAPLWPRGTWRRRWRALAAAHPAVSFGSYPAYRPGVGPAANLVARSGDAAALKAAADALRAMLREAGFPDAEETPPEG